MTADRVVALERHSPLGNAADAVVARGASSTITERPFLAQVLLRMPPEAAGIAAVRSSLGLDLPAPGRLTRASGASGASTASAGRRLAFWLGPDEWLIVDAATPADLEGRLAAATRGSGGTVVDVSAQRTVLELTGSGVRDLLAAGCSIDLHPRAFEAGSVAQTQLARVDVILGRVDLATYLVAVRASFARYLVAWLTDAITGLEGVDA